jgi:hypothetical protein
MQTIDQYYNHLLLENHSGEEEPALHADAIRWR